MAIGRVQDASMLEADAAMRTCLTAHREDGMFSFVFSRYYESTGLRSVHGNHGTGRATDGAMHANYSQYIADEAK